ncbi:MAG: discoidin domain-containing protein [Planctomycetes bacterium]|nr:discoidin domain-containing protein [Planctomycetota bacterium]
MLSAAAGCDTAPIYSDPDARKAIGQVPPRTEWTARGTLNEPGKAIDGIVATAAVAQGSENLPTLTIDLGRSGTFNMIVVDHGRHEMGFARQVVVKTSLDGRLFQEQCRAPGTRRVSTFMLIRPVLARYIRLEAVVPGDRPWSVAEVYIQ